MKKSFFICLLLVLRSLGLTFAQAPHVHLHTSKEAYSAGEHVWFSAFLTNPTNNNLLSNAQPLHVQLYNANGQPVATNVIYTQNGRGYGYLKLKLSFVGGVYRLVAFTKQMAEAGQLSQKYLTVRTLADDVVALPPATMAQPVAVANPMRVSIGLEKLIFKPRERVFVRVKATNAEGKPVAGTFSMSVTEAIAAGGQEQQTILQHLPAATPSLNFNPQDEGLNYGGLVVNNKTNEAIANANVILMVLDSTKNYTKTAITDEQGRFVFPNLFLNDYQNVAYQVNNQKGKVIVEAVVKWADVLPPLILPALVFEHLPMDEPTKRKYVENLQIVADPFNDFDEAITLQEIEIKGTNDDSDYTEVGMIKLHTNADYTINVTEKNRVLGANGLLTMMSMLPGVTVLGSNIYIRGIGTWNNNTPLFLVDGTPGGYDSINPNDVIRIEVLSGAKAAIYGMSAGNGVIAIYTRRFRKQRYTGTPLSQTATLRGFQRDNAFNAPDYGLNTPADNTPDTRQTIYWNPEIITDDNGETWVSFYANDVAGNYRILVEGMTRDQAGAFTTLIAIKK